MSFSSHQEVTQELKQRGLSQKFCHIPFSTLLLEPDGRVGGCRHKGTEFIVGHLGKNTFEEIWNGPFMQNWRKEFLEGNPQICKKEVRHIGCNLCPEYNSLLPQVDFDVIQKKPPIRVALNLNGRCNLKCRMCHIWKFPNGLYDQFGMWPKIEEIASSIQELELLSGEPFIQKDTFRLIDLFGRVNPNCLWSITTNCHWKLNDKIRGQLDRLQFKQLVVSLDSLRPETYSKIRLEGDLAVVLANLDRLIEYDASRVGRGLGSLNIRINALIQQDNWVEIPEFYAFEKKIGRPVFRSFLYEPFQYSLLSLSEKEREEILRFYLTALSPPQILHSKRVIWPLLESLSPLARAEFWLVFKEKQGIQ